MGDRLKQGLQSSSVQIQLGLAEAEAELSAIQRRCEEIEGMISLGRAIFIAAEMQVGHGLTALEALEAAQAGSMDPPVGDAPVEPPAPITEPDEPRIVEPALDTTVEAPRLERVTAPAPVEPVTAPAREPARQPAPEPVMEPASAGIATAVAVAEVPEFPMALDLATRLTGETVQPPAPETAGTYLEPGPVAEQEAEGDTEEAPTLAELLVGMGSASASADPAPAEESGEYLMADLELENDQPAVVAVAHAEAETEKESRRTTTLAARLAGGHIRLTNADLERSAADLAERLRNASVARTIAS